jgi:hypothetical protein
MKEPDVRGPSASRKAHLALRDKLNRKSKPAPELPSNREFRDRARRGSAYKSAGYGKS